MHRFPFRNRAPRRVRTTVLLLLAVVLGLATVGSYRAPTAEAAPSAAAGQSADPAADRAAARRVQQRIHAPVIPARQYRITDFGAVGDGVSDARPAITAAIAQASRRGGGHVVLPAGTWFSKGPIDLASSIDLHLSAGATLLFSPAAADYLPAVKTRWEGTEMYGYSPLVYARDVHDVSITGTGVIDGNADSEFVGWHDRQAADQAAVHKMGFDGVPVEQRVFAAGHYLRPSAVQFFGATRVLLQDYTIHNSPFWINHLVYTDQATVRNLVVDSHIANNDGVDVDSSTDVLIEGNTFRTGDDSVVVKSGRDLDGRLIGRPSRDVVVRDNDMGGEDGIALGSEMSGGISNVYFVHNVLRNGASAIRFKGNLDRGGTVEHIRVMDMQVESFDTFIWFQLNYPGDLGGNFPPTYRDIVFSDITVASADKVLIAHAPEATPLSDVLLRNVTVDEASSSLELENVQRLRFQDVRINGDRVDGSLDWK